LQIDKQRMIDNYFEHQRTVIDYYSGFDKLINKIIVQSNPKKLTEEDLKKFFKEIFEDNVDENFKDKDNVKFFLDEINQNFMIEKIINKLKENEKINYYDIYFEIVKPLF